MATGIKKKNVRQPSLARLSQEFSRLRSRVEELEDLRDLNSAAERNQVTPGVPWVEAKRQLGIG